MKKNTVLRLVEKMEQLNTKRTAEIHAMIGFDGFVDEVVHVVKKRIDAKTYIREETLTDYGNRIANTAGYSSNVEIVSLSKKLGGNGPILTNSLNNLGVKTNYCGAVGYPNIHPVFEEMAKNCECILPISDPASTDAVEFNDGKIIRSKLSAFNGLHFESLKKKVGLGKLITLLDRCNLICFVNWTLVPYSGQIWQGILDEAVSKLSVDTKDKILFFDLADPASRTKDDLKAALETIRSYGRYFRVVLGMNLSEAVQVAAAIGCDMEKSEKNLQALCDVIESYMQIDTVVIHPVKQACAICKGEYCYIEGPYCEKPKLTTGAGDNFNAGFVLGKALGLALGESLALGAANSGFYVRNSRSGNHDEILTFLKRWVQGKIV